MADVDHGRRGERSSASTSSSRSRRRSGEQAQVRAALGGGLRPERAAPTASARSTCRCSRSSRCSRRRPCCSSAGAWWRTDRSRSATFVAFNLYVVMLSCRCGCSACGSARRSARPRRASGSSRCSTSPRRSRDRPGADALPPGAGRIRFEGVTFGYDPERPVLDGVDLELEPGTHGRADRPHRLGQDDARLARPALLRRAATGACSIDGVDVRDVTLTSLRREIGIVAQDPFLFSDDACARTSRSAAPDATRRGDRARGAARAGARVHRAAAGRLRHGDRRARDHALGRPAPADRDRAGARRSTRGS